MKFILENKEKIKNLSENLIFKEMLKELKIYDLDCDERVNIHRICLINNGILEHNTNKITLCNWNLDTNNFFKRPKEQVS